MDCKLEVIKRLQTALIGKVEDVETITNALMIVLNDFDVQELHTELVPYDNVNERILKRYAACMTVEGKKPTTIRIYVHYLRDLEDALRMPFTEMKTYDIRYYISSKLAGGTSYRTAENIRSYCASFFKWITDEEIIDKNPCALIKPIKYPKKEKLPFSDVEIDTLRSACNNTMYRAMIEFMLSSGVRVTELANLTLFDVDLKEMTVRVRNGKGGKDRTTYINSVAAHYLEEYLNTRTEKGAALFYSLRHHELTKNSIETIIRQIGRTAGVSNVHPHRFRRTFATKLAERGMPIQEIQSLLGHADINTTMEYVSTNKTQIEMSYRKHIA